MKTNKLQSPEELAARVVSYAAFVEKNRVSLKGVGANTSQELADIAARAGDVKTLAEKVDELERDFLTSRAELKASVVQLELALNDQLDCAREFARNHRLTVIRDGLKSFGRPNRRHRKDATTDVAGKDANPSA